MNIKEIKKEALLARICATRQIMGEDAAQAAAESINQLLKEKVHGFGRSFMPDYYPRQTPRLVSCYALFK